MAESIGLILPARQRSGPPGLLEKNWQIVIDFGE
jgi:hypothetical protein